MVLEVVLLEVVLLDGWTKRVSEGGSNGQTVQSTGGGIEKDAKFCEGWGRVR